MTLTIIAMMMAQSSPSLDWTSVADKYGLPLLLVIVIMAGKLTPGFVYERRYQEVVAERAARDDDNRRHLAELAQEREKRERLEEAIRNDMIPALIGSAEATKRLIELLPRAEALLREREMGR